QSLLVHGYQFRTSPRERRSAHTPVRIVQKSSSAEVTEECGFGIISWHPMGCALARTPKVWSRLERVCAGETGALGTSYHCASRLCPISWFLLIHNPTSNFKQHSESDQKASK